MATHALVSGANEIWTFVPIANWSISSLPEWLLYLAPLGALLGAIAFIGVKDRPAVARSKQHAASGPRYSLSDVRRIAEAQDDIDNEMLRSRRYNRPLSVVSVRRYAPLNSQAHGASFQKIVIPLFGDDQDDELAQLIGGELRRMDFLIQGRRRSSLAILAPETTSEQAVLLGQRIQLLAKRAGHVLTFGTASFPDQALTFDDLLTKAEASSKRSLIVEGAESLDEVEKFERISLGHLGHAGERGPTLSVDANDTASGGC